MGTGVPINHPLPLLGAPVVSPIGLRLIIIFFDILGYATKAPNLYCIC